MSRPVLHLPHHVDPEIEGQLIEARARLVRAKAQWSRCAVQVLTKKATASDVDTALKELDQAHAELERLMHRDEDEQA